VLGDPRGAADIERAHEEALREHRRRFPRTAADLTERLFAAGGIDLDMQHVASQARGPSPEMQRMLDEARRRTAREDGARQLADRSAGRKP
jgi:hypothetical protein